MKCRYAIFSTVCLFIAMNATAQIKLHDGGAITIGSTSHPGSNIMKVSKTSLFDAAVTFDNTAEFNLPVTFDNALTMNGAVSFSGNVDFSSVSSNILPATGSLNMGSSEDVWFKIYCDNLYSYNLTSDYLTLTAYNTNVKSDLVPYTDNLYSLGREAIDQGGPHWWKDVFSHKLTSNTLEVNNLDIAVTYSSYYGATGISFDFGPGELDILSGPTSYIDFNTSKSYYDFDEELRVQGTYYYSDITLKTDVEKIKDTGSSLEKVKELEGIKYKLIEDKDELVYAGFSAQEMQKDFPHLVFEDEEGILSVNYIGLIPYLVEALKEQEVRITELEKALEMK